MNMLPTTLIAATLLSGGLFTQAGAAPLDVSALQQAKKPCVQTRIIIGSIGNSPINPDGLCGNLKDILSGCIRPSTPDIEIPDAEIPDNTPEATPPVDNVPDTTPEIEVPEAETPAEEEPPAQDETAHPYIKRVVELVNAERAKVNLPALTMSDSLNKAAGIRAVETTRSFSHTRPNGKSFSSVLSENGITFRGAGENIAWGQKSPEAVVNAWMNSEGHRANILSPKFTSIGVGYYLNGSTPYWSQLFIY